MTPAEALVLIDKLKRDPQTRHALLCTDMCVACFGRSYCHTADEAAKRFAAMMGEGK